MGLDNVIQAPLTGSSVDVVAQPSSPDAVTGRLLHAEQPMDHESAGR